MQKVAESMFDVAIVWLCQHASLGVIWEDEKTDVLTLKLSAIQLKRG